MKPPFGAARLDTDSNYATTNPTHPGRGVHDIRWPIRLCPDNLNSKTGSDRASFQSLKQVTLDMQLICNNGQLTLRIR